MSIIELSHLTKCYGKHRGIEDVSFTVEEGEIFGLAGPKGAGKSTVLRAMLDLVHPTSGTAKLFGLDSRKDGRRIRREVGYLPGEVFYGGDMRLKQLLTYSASFYHKDCRTRMHELAECMELDLNRRVGALTSRERKKVGIVQSLLHDPKLLLLDEPTAGLDPLMQQRLFGLLREESQKGATILFSSQLLSEVQRLCHRTATLREGRLVALQTKEALRGQCCRRVTVEGADLTPASFQAEGIADLYVDENGAEFLWRGTPGRLLEILRDVEMANLWIGEPSLEEVLLHYDKGGDAG